MAEKGTGTKYISASLHIYYDIFTELGFMDGDNIPINKTCVLWQMTSVF